MDNKCFKGIIFFISLFGWFNLISQDLGLNLMNGLPNSYINPAFNTDKQLIIGLGNKQYNLGNESFTLNDVFEDGENGKVLVLRNAIDQVNDRNLAHYSEGLKTLEIGYKLNNTIIYGGHGWKLNASLSYRKDLIRLIAFGNEPFIGETLNIGSSVSYNSYNETYVGFSTGNDRFRFGMRAKVLNGVQNLSTGNEKLSIKTSDEIYQLEIDADYEVFSSDALIYNDLDDYEFNLNRFSTDSYFSDNWGWGLDVGISTQLGPVEVFMSGLDLGSIKYTSNSARYFNNEKKSFEGVDILDYINTTAEFSIEDSIKELVNLQEDSTSYSVGLNGRIVIGGKYKINDIYNLGVVFSRQSFGVDNAHSLMLNAQRKFGKHVTVGLSWTYRDNSFANIGGIIVGEYGPVQVYAVAHNALGALLPESFKSLSIRFGATLGFNQLSRKEDVSTNI